MTQFFISRQAYVDAYVVWSYIAENNPTAADKWSHTLGETYAMLAQHPRLGPSRDDLIKDLRYFPMDSYLIMYREMPDGIEIARVVHGARNLEAIFHSDEP